MNSKRIKMSYKLSPQIVTSKYHFEIIDIGDVTELAMVMLHRPSIYIRKSDLRKRIEPRCDISHTKRIVTITESRTDLK